VGIPLQKEEGKMTMMRQDKERRRHNNQIQTREMGWQQQWEGHQHDSSGGSKGWLKEEEHVNNRSKLMEEAPPLGRYLWLLWREHKYFPVTTESYRVHTGTSGKIADIYAFLNKLLPGGTRFP